MLEPKNEDYWVERHLENWRAWMHSSELPKGYPNKACGGATNYTSLDLDNIATYEALDANLAESVDAAINDLSPVESCAIYNRYLHAVYRFKREDMDDVLARAKQNLKPLLARRNVWMGQ